CGHSHVTLPHPPVMLGLVPSIHGCRRAGGGMAPRDKPEGDGEKRGRISDAAVAATAIALPHPPACCCAHSHVTLPTTRHARACPEHPWLATGWRRDGPSGRARG